MIQKLENKETFLRLFSPLGLGNQQCTDVNIDPQVHTNKSPSDVRIPTKLHPLHYNVELQPHIYRFDVDYLNHAPLDMLYITIFIFYSCIRGQM